MPLHLDRKSAPGPQSIDWQRVALGYEARIAELEAALRSVVQQCDNVIFNTAGGADNDRHLAAWRNVRDFAWRNASKP